MAENGIELKVYLEPELKKVENIQKELGEIVKNSGEKDIQKKFEQLQAKLIGIRDALEKPLSEKAFSNLGGELKTLLSGFGQLAAKLGSLPTAVQANLTKVEKQLDDLDKRIEQTSNSLNVIKKSGKIDKDGTFFLYKKTADKRTESQGFTRMVASQGAKQGDPIKNYESLQKYYKQLESLEQPTEEIKNQMLAIRGFFDSLNNEVKDNANQFKRLSDTLNDLNRQRQEKVDELNKAAEDAKDGGGELSADQLKAQEIVSATISGKVEIDNAIVQGKAAAKDNAVTTPDEETVDVPKLAGESKKENKNTGIIGKAAKNLISYTVVLGTMKKALRNAVETIQVLDKALTEQAMVSGMTREQVYGLLSSYQELAMASGATTKEVATVATEFFRQGKSSEEALTLTEAAVKAAKVASISTSDSVDYLTTAINGFKMSAQDAMDVSDRFAALAASSATSYEELAIALSKTASQANLAGMSMDYTLGLLAKGIETTREAPETIGTALKTVIARMREISDYGETLDGETNINNVEQNLSYVGIQLRTVSGELRSTEDVLDELGRKWDTLSSNQQAAIARSLAGTRQQSRLISMMNDYQRTLELVQISERSNGATAAQAATYMLGMEAAINKVTVAGEKLITALTNSEALIAIVDFVGELVNGIAIMAENEALVHTTLVAIGAVGAVILANKMREKILDAQIAAHNIDILKQKKEGLSKDKIAAAQADALLAKAKLQEKIQAKISLQKEYQAEMAKAERMGQSTDDIKLKYTIKLADAEKEINEAQQEYNTAQYESLSLQQQSLEVSKDLKSSLSSVPGIIGSIISGFTTLLIKRKANLILSKKENKEDQKGLLINMGKNAAKWMPIVGIAFAIACLAAAGIAALVPKFVSQKSKSGTEKATEDVQSLSAEIYNLQKSTTAIKTAISEFENLDKKVIKTKEDIEAMNKALTEGGNALTDEQKKYYNTLGDNQKLEYLKQVKEINEKAIAQKRALQLQTINNAGASEMLKESSNQAVVFDIITEKAYEYIDSLKELGQITSEEADNMSRFTKQLISNMDAYELYTNYIDKNFSDLGKGESKSNIKSTLRSYGLDDSDENAKKIKEKGWSALTDIYKDSADQGRVEKLLTDVTGGLTKDDLVKQWVDKVADSSIDINGKAVLASDILTTDDYSIQNQINAYQQLVEKFGKSSEEVKALNKEFGSLKDIIDTFEQDKQVITWAEGMGIGVNKLSEAIEKFKKAGLETEDVLEIIAMMAEGKSREAIEEFAKTLDGYDAARFNSAWTNVIDGITGGFQTIGQEVQSYKNQIEGIYEAQQKYLSGELKGSEWTDYIAEHQDIFNQEGFYEAFISGGNITDLIKNSNSYFEKTRLNLIKRIEQAIEAANNEAEKEVFRLQKAALEKSDSLYSPSLQMQLEREQAAVDKYKEYLQQQADDLKDSLNERKNAYQKYFDAINQAYEDQDYEEQQQLLIENLGKIGAGTDATSMAKIASLESTLKENEKERRETLRQRAQDTLLNSLDDQVSNIEKTLQQQLNNEKDLLNTIKSESFGKDIFNNMLMAITESGKLTGSKYNSINDLTTTVISGGADLSKLDDYIKMENGIISIGSFVLNEKDNPEAYNTLVTLFSAARQQNGQSAI